MEELKVGDVISPLTLGKRNFNVHEVFKSICGSVKVMSWGAHAWTYKEGLFIRFKVNGHHHKGHVYIILDWNDTFEIYYTTTRGTIKAISHNIYVDQLIDIIDEKVEYQNEYKDNEHVGPPEMYAGDN